MVKIQCNNCRYIAFSLNTFWLLQVSLQDPIYFEAIYYFANTQYTLWKQFVFGVIAFPHDQIFNLTYTVYDILLGISIINASEYDMAININIYVVWIWRVKMFFLRILMSLVCY